MKEIRGLFRDTPPNFQHAENAKNGRACLSSQSRYS